MQTQEPVVETPTIIATPETSQQSWGTAVQPWWQAILAVLPIFLLARFIFLVLSYFGGVLFFVPNYWPGQLDFHRVLYTWYHWDAVRYATIATNGYITE